MTHDRSPARGTTYALIGAALFGVNGSVAKVVLLTGLDPAQLTFLRGLATALVSGAILVATDKAQFRIGRREVMGLAALGILGLAMLQWLYAIAISRLPVGVALLIEYTAVVMVALAAWLIFKERLERRVWWAIAAVLVGLAVVARIWDSHLDALGVLAAAGAALAYAYYFLAGERLGARRPPMAIVFWAATFATAFWGVFSGWWTIPVAQLARSVSLTGALESVMVPAWLPLLWVLTLGAFVPFLLSFAALRHLSATAVGILAASEVLFAFATAWLWLGEALAPIEVAGAVLVLGGIVLAQTARHRPPTGPPAAAVPTEVP